jgi:hypothetical protein
LSSPVFTSNFLKQILKVMAKASGKSATKESKKPATKTPKVKATGGSIEKASTDALEKLKALGIETELQNDIEWCLGSYRADGNPVGLFSMVERAIMVFKSEQAKKTKGVTAKFVADLEKAANNK